MISFDAEEIVLIRAVAAGVLDEEVERYLSVRKDVESKLAALGGLTEAQTNLARAKSMLAQAAHDSEKAKVTLAEAREAAAKEVKEAESKNGEARRLLDSAKAESDRVAGERQQLNSAKGAFESYKNQESDALAILSRDLKEKEQALAAGRKDLAEKITKMKQMI